MAQQTDADDASTELANADPELAATTLEQAADSLQVHLTRDEMREACRNWDLDGYSGTKQEMAETMLEQAEEQALALLVEEGVELGGDLVDEAEQEAAEAEAEDDEEAEQEQDDAQDEAEQEATEDGLVAPEDVPAETMAEVAQEYGMGAGAVKGSLAFNAPSSDDDCTSEADEAALEARRRATPGYEAEDEDEDEQDQPEGSLAHHLLARHPEDYGYTAKLQMTEKQTAACVAAFEDLEASQDEVAEAADCTKRYANSTLNRWRGTEDEVEAVEDEGVQVPAEFMEHEVMA